MTGMVAKREERLPLTETAIRRIKMAVVNGLLQAEYGSIPAVMRARGELAEGEYDAAMWFLQLRKSYLQAIDAREVKGQNLSEGGRGEPPDPDSLAGRDMNRRDRQAVEKFLAAAKVVKGCGTECAADFEALVLVEHRDGLSLFPSNWQRSRVRMVCIALRRHRETWRTGQRAKR
jgi:hypothetical protein